MSIEKSSEAPGIMVNVLGNALDTPGSILACLRFTSELMPLKNAYIIFLHSPAQDK